MARRGARSEIQSAANSTVTSLTSLSLVAGVTSVSSRSPLLSTYNWSESMKVADVSIGLSLIILNTVLIVLFVRFTYNR